MDTKDAAAKAIVATHGTQINGYTCKCSWGKETDSSSSSQKQTPPQQNSAYPPAQVSCIHLLFYRVFNTPGNLLELFFLLEIFWKFAKSPGNFLAESVCLLLL